MERANEEARIFYVAMTRAKARLHLVTTKEVKENRGEGDYLSTNSFTDFLSLGDMPVKCYAQSELSFGEDRLVKKAFQTFNRMGIYSEVARDVIRPSAEECVKNSRAKSTKMRWAIRSDLQD